MKKYLAFLVIFVANGAVQAQFNAGTLSGGYAFTNIEQADASGSGWRINGLYEYYPIVGKLVHGFSVGYVSTSAEITETDMGQIIESKYTVNSLPLYYTPKLLIGDNSFRGFVKGALGMQFSNLKRTGTLAELTTKDAGFYGGLGAGVMKDFGEKIFLNLEYEWAYSSNSYYRDGFLNSVMLGLGMKF